MKNVLVTGASGRLGKHLVKRLKKGNKVIEFDRSHGYNILNTRDLSKFSRSVKLVYHLASLVSYTASYEELYKINVIGTKNVMNSFKKVPVVYMSSTSVYGNKLKKIPADEGCKPSPQTNYGLTKLEAERIVLDSNGIVIRAPSIYGPGFSEGFFDVFKMIENGKMKIFGNGRNRLDFIHVKDLVNALVLAGKYGRRGEIYNISGPDVATQEDIYKTIAKYLGVVLPESHIPTWVAKLLSGKKQRAYIDKLSSDRVFDISKAKRELRWEPKIGYEEGIREMVNIYRNTSRGRSN